MKMILVTIFININLSLEAVWPPKCISLVIATCINFWYHFLINSFPFGCQPTIILNPVHCHTTLYVPNSKVGKWPRPPTRAYFFSASFKNDYQTVIGPIRVRLGLFWMLVKTELVTFIKYNEWNIFVWLWELSYCHSGASLIQNKAHICRNNDGQPRS